MDALTQLDHVYFGLPVHCQDLFDVSFVLWVSIPVQWNTALKQGGSLEKWIMNYNECAAVFNRTNVDVLQEAHVQEENMLGLAEFQHT